MELLQKFLLFFGYDCYQKPWYQDLCERVTGHHVQEAEYNHPMEDVGYRCRICGKHNL